MPFGKQSGEGAALPVAPAETVKGSGRRGGAARSPATGEDTARLDDDARNGRRLPLDRLGRGCVADRKTKRLRTGVSGRKPVDPPERQKDHRGPRRARASPVSSSWAAPRWQERSEGKAASSVLHRQPATARPVDHRLFARSLWSRLQPAPAPRLHSQGRCGARLDNRAYGPRQRSRPQGRDRQGRATRTGGRGTGSGRDRHPPAAAGSIALTSSGGGRLAGRNRGRDPKGDARWYIQS